MAQIPSRFGPYEVVALLGAGGMGEVYRARDPRLNRVVAIKVLARSGADPARQQRFLDEAQAASALNHPNIITVYDVGTHDGAPFIVSELVEGTSVRDILARAPLTIREVLDIGVQMADGLAAAHQAGIVHRDFKPENVMVTRDGRVKILDFGLALVGAREGSASDVDVTLTATAQIVGTIPYMSPEQARGAAVDFRTDQFSFGLTLYEMATGRRAFSAETSAQILTRILEDEPEPLAKLNARVPAPVRWIIERCLSKDARQRYDSTADLTRELRTLRDRLTELTSAADVVAPAPRRTALALLGVAALTVAVAIGALAVFTSSRADAGLERYQFTPFATDAGYQASPAWSPDGKTLAFVADVDGILQIFTRALASSMRAQVTRSRFDCRDPFWSPDGTRLYFISRARDRDGLWSISASGGAPEIVMENVSRAELSPDGKTLAFFRNTVAEENATGMTMWLATPPDASPVAYTRPPFGARTGYSQATLHFSPDGSKLGVWAVASLSAETATEPSEFWVLPMGNGVPRLVPSPVPDLHGMAPAFSWLPDNRRVLSAVPRPNPGLHMWLMDTERGDARLLVSTAGLENDPAVSPGGTRLALTLQQADFDLYQLSLDRPPSVVLATSRNEMDPTWSASLTGMAFTTDRNGREEIWLRSQKGDFERPLVTPDDFSASRTDFLSAPEVSPDGRRVAYNRIGADGNRVWISPVAGGPPVPLAQGPQAQDWPSWSPDGVWIACAQVVVGKNTWALAKVRVGARTPSEVVASDILPLSPVHWSPSGNWIAYNSVRGLSIVAPDGQSTRVLHEDAWMAFAWSADSQKVYGIRQSDDLTHLTFTSVDVASGAEHVLSPDIMPAPVARQPVRGLTRTSPTTFVASIVHVRSDVWLLDGFRSEPTLWNRLFR